MDTEKMNKMTTVRVTKNVTTKLKLLSALRGNAETISSVIGSLADKELKRFNIPGNNDD